MPVMAALGENTKTLIPQPSQILTVFTKDGNPIDITLDGGATGSFIKHSYAKEHNFKIWPNNQTAGLADSKTSVKSVGYIEEVFYRDSWAVKFKGLVVDNLKANIYGGQPFMIENDIIQRPAKNIITVLGKYTVMQTNSIIPTKYPNSAALITLAKMNIEKKVLLPNQCVQIPNRGNLPEGPILIDVRSKTNNIAPYIQDDNQTISITNNTDAPLSIPTDINCVDITMCNTINIADIQTKPHMPGSTSIGETTNENHKKISSNINQSLLNDNQMAMLDEIHTTYKNVFDGHLTGYNGRFGKHIVSLQWADNTRPKTNKLYSPMWSSSKDVVLQKKIDQLTEMGVLADPYEHNIQVKCVHPCFLQKKARAGDKNVEDCSMDEIRFLTAPSAVNDKCRQVQTKVPDQNEIFKFLANNKFVIFADLYESFFQNHLNKQDWGYMAINSPFKGLRVYTRSTQGLINQDEELSQLLSKVIGQNIMDGHCMKIADDLIVGGNTIDHAIENWKSVLKKLSEANLKLSPTKVRIFPEETTIYGWNIVGGKIKPDPHRQLALSNVKHSDINTITDLRSWIGTYKTFLIAMPGLAQIVDPFEKLTAGVKDAKTKILWTPQLITKFDEATEKISKADLYLTLPNKDEQLILMPDATIRQPAIGFTLNVIRNDKVLPVIYYSFKLSQSQSRWWPCEQEALAMAMAIKKCSHYILNSNQPTLILTDSKPVVEAFHLMKRGKFSTSSRMAAFLYSTNQFKIDIQHISGKYKQNIGPDYLSRNPYECNNSKCEVCKFISDSTKTIISNADVHVSNNSEHTMPVEPNIHECNIDSIHLHSAHIEPSKLDLPIGSVNTWKTLQMEDYACSEAFKRLTSGQQPNKRGHLSNDIRKYFNNCQAANLLIVPDKIPNTTQIRNRIVIPKDFIPAVVAQLHHKHENHPTAYQLEKLFNRYFYGIHTKSVIDEVINSCYLCKSNKYIEPFKKEFKTISNPTHPGITFNIDIMRRNGQKIMVCRDLFSSFTSTAIVKSEQTQCLMNGIIQCTTDIRSKGNITVRTDSATGFKALQNNSILEKLGITVETTDSANKNSIATVDNAIKELEQELIKISPHNSSVNDAILAMATTSMNNKIRNRNLTASEILFARDNVSQQNIHFLDEDLQEKQHQTKLTNNLHASNSRFKYSPLQQYIPQNGDTVVLVHEKDKTKSRDLYIVTNVSTENAQINKILKYHSEKPRIQTTSRIVPITDLYPIQTTNSSRIHQQKRYIRKSEEKPKPVNSQWYPFPNYHMESDYDTDSDIPITKSTSVSNTVAKKSNNNGDNNDTDDQSNTHQDQNSTDPYQHLKEWEENQRKHAKQTIHQQTTNEITNALVSNLDLSFKNIYKPIQTNNSTTNHPLQSDSAISTEDLYWDDFDTPPNIEQGKLSQVQDINRLFEESVCLLDTNKVQNLDHILPLKETRLQKKKRVSPPRSELPIEKERRHRHMLYKQ